MSRFFEKITVALDRRLAEKRRGMARFRRQPGDLFKNRAPLPIPIEKLTDEQLDALEIALRETVLKLESPDEGDVIEGKVESEELDPRATSRLIAPRRAN